MSLERVAVKKLEAAKRQLHTAIKLWFADADQVSVHTLACAAHQIVHDININKEGEELLLDSLLIREEFRKEYVREMKKAMNFFKHADTDPNPIGAVEFSPPITELFILFAILGLQRFGEHFTETTSAFLLFYAIRNPHLVTKEFSASINSASIKIEDVANLPAISKLEFWEQFLLVRRQQNHS